MSVSRFIYVTVFVLFLSSCIQTPPPRSGIDWKKLEAKYSKQPKDSLKLQAVCFLRENIDDITSEVPVFFDTEGKEVDIRLNTISNEESLIKILREKKLQYSSKLVADTLLLSTQYIDSCIDYAFNIWQKNPWNKNISKDIFFNNLLPYKALFEEPSNWWPYFAKHYGKAAPYNSTRKWNKLQTDLHIAKYIRMLDTAHILFFLGKGRDVVNLTLFPGFKEIRAVQAGDCYRINGKYLYLYRSLGLPAAFDFTPHYGGGNAGHSAAASWNDSLQIFETKYAHRFLKRSRPAKIFRLSFKKRNIWKDSIFPYTGEDFLIGELKHNHWNDVTHEYRATDCIVYPDKEHSRKYPYAYICTFTYGEWKPIYWGKAVAESFIFNNMAKDIFYQTAYPDKSSVYGFILSGDVFHFTKQGAIERVKPYNSKKQNITLKQINYGERAYIEKGRSYTLFLLTEKGLWQPLQKKNSSKDSLISFKGIPRNGLYLLEDDLAAKKLARPFLWIKDSVIWY